MMLFISVLLALAPLLGIAWIVLYGSITTVDGLFMSLILLAMSGIVGLNVLIELKKKRSGAKGLPTAASAAPAGFASGVKWRASSFTSPA